MDLRFGQDHQEWATLAQVSSPRRRRWSSPLAASLGIHVVILAILCLPAAPIFIRPRLLAHGEGGNATPTSVVLSLPNDIQLAAQNTQALLSLPAQPHKKPQKSRARKRTNILEVENLPILLKLVQNSAPVMTAKPAVMRSSPRYLTFSRT